MGPNGSKWVISAPLGSTGSIGHLGAAPVPHFSPGPRRALPRTAAQSQPVKSNFPIPDWGQELGSITGGGVATSVKWRPD